MTAKLKLAYQRPLERIYGAPGFIALTRNAGLKSPVRFEATKKLAGDIVI